TGAAWLTKNAKSALVFAGIKALGTSWYGFSDGQVCHEGGSGCSSSVSLRGWWATNFSRQLLFYDPNDLARVASGEWESWQPQPYASLSIENQMYYRGSSNTFQRLGGVTFDREHGILYVAEGFGDGEKPLVHAWRISA
ncbi:TPA: hypothetical protein HA318_04365, partial [Candidatus Micrarchaeota archaeon]|nr:hypothetical protein [Candidatus Micrarchaeota archaeon]